MSNYGNGQTRQLAPKSYINVVCCHVCACEQANPPAVASTKNYKIRNLRRHLTIGEQVYGESILFSHTAHMRITGF